MSQPTRKEILERLRRRYRSAGPEHKGKLLDQAQELLGAQPPDLRQKIVALDSNST